MHIESKCMNITLCALTKPLSQLQSNNRYKTAALYSNNHAMCYNTQYRGSQRVKCLQGRQYNNTCVHCLNDCVTPETIHCMCCLYKTSTSCSACSWLFTLFCMRTVNSRGGLHLRQTTCIEVNKDCKHIELLFKSNNK